MNTKESVKEYIAKRGGLKALAQEEKNTLAEMLDDLPALKITKHKIDATEKNYANWDSAKSKKAKWLVKVNGVSVAVWGGGQTSSIWGSNEFSDLAYAQKPLSISTIGQIMVNGRFGELRSGGTWAKAKTALSAFLLEKDPAVIARQKKVPSLIAKKLTNVSLKV